MTRTSACTSARTLTTRLYEALRFAGFAGFAALRTCLLRCAKLVRGALFRFLGARLAVRLQATLDLGTFRKGGSGLFEMRRPLVGKAQQVKINRVGRGIKFNGALE